MWDLFITPFMWTLGIMSAIAIVVIISLIVIAIIERYR